MSKDACYGRQPCRLFIVRLEEALPCICGAVAEWSKALAWKVSIRQNRIEGSNPSRSATYVYFSFFFMSLVDDLANFDFRLAIPSSAKRS